MDLFLAECYLPGTAPDEGSALLAGVQQAAVSMAQRGVVHLRSIVLPDDAVCLVFFQAPDEVSVQAAMRDAGVAADRVVRAVAEPGLIR